MLRLLHAFNSSAVRQHLLLLSFPRPCKKGRKKRADDQRSANLSRERKKKISILLSSLPSEDERNKIAVSHLSRQKKFGDELCLHPVKRALASELLKTIMGLIANRFLPWLWCGKRLHIVYSLSNLTDCTVCLELFFAIFLPNVKTTHREVKSGLVSCHASCFCS